MIFADLLDKRGKLHAICPFEKLDQFPSVESWVRNGENRTLQAIKLESGNRENF